MASPWDSQYASVRERIYHYADRYRIDRSIAIWQLWQENKFKRTGCSSSNACGIAQFIPNTAARFGVNVNDIESSLDGWGRYMRQMLDMFGQRVDIALAGYNSGENRAEYRNAAREGRPINWSIMPARVRSETKHYVEYITSQAGVSAAPTGTANPTPTGTSDPAGASSDGTDNTMYLALGLLLFVLILD